MASSQLTTRRAAGLLDAGGRIIAASCMHGELNGISAFGKAMDAQPLLMNRQLECGVELRNWACKRAKNSSKTIQAHRVSPVRTLVPSACRCKKRRARAFVLRRWKEQPNGRRIRTRCPTRPRAVAAASLVPSAPSVRCVPSFQDQGGVVLVRPSVCCTL